MPATATLPITNKKGLHARAAAKFVKTAGQFPDTKVFVTKVIRDTATEEVRVLATSVLGLLMLAAEKGTMLECEADGAATEAVLGALRDLVERKFDEGE